MRKRILGISLVSAFVFAACTEKKESEPVTEIAPAVEEVVDNTATDVDSIEPQAMPEKNTQLAEGTEVTVKGEITEINQGKDGYTAKIKIADGTVYFAAISIPNLKDPKQYKKYNVGDIIKVKGKTFTIEEDTLIKVEELY